MFASDDEEVPEYDVHQDDEPELEMIGVTDVIKMKRRRAYGELEAWKEPLMKSLLQYEIFATEKIAR